MSDDVAVHIGTIERFESESKAPRGIVDVSGIKNDIVPNHSAPGAIDVFFMAIAHLNQRILKEKIVLHQPSRSLVNSM